MERLGSDPQIWDSPVSTEIGHSSSSSGVRTAQDVIYDALANSEIEYSSSSSAVMPAAKNVDRLSASESCRYVGLSTSKPADECTSKDANVLPGAESRSRAGKASPGSRKRMLVKDLVVSASGVQIAHASSYATSEDHMNASSRSKKRKPVNPLVVSASGTQIANANTSSEMSSAQDVSAIAWSNPLNQKRPSRSKKGEAVKGLFHPTYEIMQETSNSDTLIRENQDVISGSDLCTQRASSSHETLAVKSVGTLPGFQCPLQIEFSNSNILAKTCASVLSGTASQTEETTAGVEEQVPDDESDPLGPVKPGVVWHMPDEENCLDIPARVIFSSIGQRMRTSHGLSAVELVLSEISGSQDFLFEGSAHCGSDEVAPPEFRWDAQHRSGSSSSISVAAHDSSTVCTGEPEGLSSEMQDEESGLAEDCPSAGSEARPGPLLCASQQERGLLEGMASVDAEAPQSLYFDGSEASHSFSRDDFCGPSGLDKFFTDIFSQQFVQTDQSSDLEESGAMQAVPPADDVNGLMLVTGYVSRGAEASVILSGGDSTSASVWPQQNACTNSHTHPRARAHTRTHAHKHTYARTDICTHTGMHSQRMGTGRLVPVVHL